MRRLLVALLLMTATACATASPPAASPSQAEPATLSVTLAEPAPGAPMYIEGAVRFVRITADGVQIAQKLPFDKPAEITLPGAGSYLFQTWARPCDGNCGYLDAPTDRCAETLTVTGGATIAVEIDPTPGRDCTITVTS